MRIALHICCGICASEVIETLCREEHQIVGFFYNPNIHPENEYRRRLTAVYKISRELNFPLIVPPYTPEEWLAGTSIFKKEPEGGKRCHICFEMRLQKTYLYMKNSKCDAFTTTLTISPHKSAEAINRIGYDIGGERFLTRNFKKKGGFNRANRMAKQWNLYRQNYCGCIYSIRDQTHEY